jgi:hypothetical protein
MLPKRNDLSASDLQELAERLGLILNHIFAFPVRGIKTIDNFLIIAIGIPGHSLYYDEKDRVFFLDGKDVTQWLDLQAQEPESSQASQSS